MALKISERIEEDENYKANMKVLVLGKPDVEKYPSTSLTTKVTKDITGTEGDIIFFTPKHYMFFLKNYCNITIQLPTDEEIEEIKQTEIYQNMETWPSQDAVKTINNVLVIKLSNQ